MSLFSRIRTPFNDPVDEDAFEPERPVHLVGRMLRERREDLDLDLETAGAALRIKPIYLAALEQGRAQDLPGPTYAVGFIRAYAHYLGFDGGRVLDRYKAKSADVRLRPDLALPVPLNDRSVPGAPLLLIAAILALCGYGTWYYLSTGERARPERVAAVPAELVRPAPLKPPQASSGTPDAAGKTAVPAAAAIPPASAKPAGVASALTGSAAANMGSAAPPTPPSGAPDGGATASAAGRHGVAALPAGASPATAAPVVPASVTAASPAPTVLAAPPAADDAAAVVGKPDGQIDIRALADCWIQVRTADQSIVFSRVLKLGETYHVPRPGLMMRVGNAGALAIEVDGKAAPPIGPIGTLRRDVVLNPEALLAGTAVHG